MIPYDKRSGKIWYNGELVDWSDVKVHVLSHGLHYASCVFEGERVYDGSIFKLEEHTSRLFHSARRMGFEIPYTENEINIATNKIIINKARAALSNFKLFCSENLLKFPLTRIPTKVGKAINKNILTENFKRFRSNSTDEKNAA